MIYNDILELVGNTPLVRLNRLSQEHGIDTPIIAKVESFNPLSSIKDRVALAMIEAAERDGKLTQGATVIEPTSGNTGVGLAYVCAVRGYKLVLTMPESMSMERRALLKALGAELVLTDAAKGMQGAVEKAQELKESIAGAIFAGQFENPANPNAHYRTTAEEIWEQSAGAVDILVAGIGTGGTISGTGKRLKELKPSVQIFGVEPHSSPLISGGVSASHKIQGIGANFIPKNYDATVVDNIVTVTNEDAFEMTRLLAQKEGILAGISSGAALCAAVQIAREHYGKTIVAILPDTGERYLSTGVFG